MNPLTNIKKISSIAFFLLLSSSLSLAVEKNKPPTHFIDKGACPFECCTYREWKTEANTIVYLLPDKNSEKVGILKAGTIVKGLTGEVHTKPIRFIVKQKHYGVSLRDYKPNDVIWVYTYLGEGYFKVWFEGEMFKEELEFSPYGGTGGKRCEEGSKYCWGELEKELDSTWWVKVKSPEGWVGWSNEPQNFSNKDACG